MTPTKASKLWPIIKAYSDGHKIKCNGVLNESPSFNHDPDSYEVLPKDTCVPVDLSVLISSGIDCEFSQTKGIKKFAGKLIDINHGNCWPYEMQAGSYFMECRPRINHTQYWPGGECPVPEGLVVDFIFKDFSTKVCSSNSVNWSASAMNRVIAFSVLGLEDGYCWPWECDE